MHMNRSWKGILCAGITVIGLYVGPSICAAAVVEGYAEITSTDEAARFKAREDAMRTFVESQVGVQVSSTTTVAEGMVISDRIMSQSNGYVKINKVIREGKQGHIYCVALDLSASDRLMSEVKDVQAAIEQLPEDSERQNIQVVVTGSDGENMKALSNYVQEKMRAGGFNIIDSAGLQAYLEQHHGNMESATMNAAIRKQAQAERLTEGTDANAVLRGIMEEKENTVVDGMYRATVYTSFELIGLSSDVVDSYTGCFTAVGRTSYEDVLEKAKQAAAKAAVEALAQQALQTEQRQNRGGVRHNRVQLIVAGITGQDQIKALEDGVAAAGIRIIRSQMVGDSCHLFVDAAGFQSEYDIKKAVEEQLPQLNEMNAAGSQGGDNIYLSF